VWIIVAWSLAALWISHLVQAALGMPKITDLNAPEWDKAATEQLRVTIVVPARNEAEMIGEALRSLRKLDYSNYEIIAVNDRSEDGTGEIMCRVAAEPEGAPLKVVDVKELPTGWLGKTHAMWLGAEQGSGEWILFTDADVVFSKDSLRRAITYAERERADHLVLFPTMLTHTVGERMMISLFQALIGFGHRPWKVADPDARDYIGVGAFNMIRRPVYEKLGTYSRLRLAILDDMKLGELVKKNRFRQRNVFGKDLIRIHWAPGVMGVIRNVTKNFFAYLRFNTALALGAALALFVFNVVPFIAVVITSGWARIGFAVALFCIFAIYAGMEKRSGIRSFYFLTHPIASSLFAYAILLSAFTAIKNGGVIWRGTKYPLSILRRSVE
jgi:cellulose synthase/poly-beta-1,6-N-acetylglucosamine synthase-like glycosyltransferase